MRRLTLFTLTAALAACGGSATSPTPGGTGEVTPSAGTSLWVFAYRAATAQTCPNATPDTLTAIMTVAPGGNSLTLASPGENLPTIAFTRDGAGLYVWQDGPATIAFRFLTSSHAEGEARRDATADLPCSAIWPVLLDRQG